MAVGQDAQFSCRHSSADDVGWQINGSSLNRIDLPGITTFISFVDSGVINMLMIESIDTIFDSTMIECVAIFFDRSPTEVTPTATLQVQSLCTRLVVIKGLL